MILSDKERARRRAHMKAIQPKGTAAAVGAWRKRHAHGRKLGTLKAATTRAKVSRCDSLLRKFD